MAMHLMAGETRDRGLIGEFRIEQAPRALLIERCDQVTDAALEVHRVAAETVVDEERLSVVVLAEEDFRVGHTVGAGQPGGVFFAVALGTALFDLETVIGF